MNLYIEVDSEGNCINHPIGEENLIQIFGSIPSKYEPFVRVEQNVFPDTFEIMNEVQYQKVDGIWTDVWTKREMDSNEKFKKNAQIAREFYSTVMNEKTNAEKSRDSASDDEQKKLWQDYIDELQRWTYIDHTGNNIPRHPTLNASGDIISLQASGTAPNVD